MLIGCKTFQRVVTVLYVLYYVYFVNMSLEVVRAQCKKITRCHNNMLLGEVLARFIKSGENLVDKKR